MARRIKSLTVTAIVAGLDRHGMALEVRVEMPIQYHQLAPTIIDRIIEAAQPEPVVHEEGEVLE